MDGDQNAKWLSWLDLWPGVTRIWWAGQSGGLVLALGFGVLLNFSLLSQLIWSGWLPVTAELLLVVATVATWCYGAYDSRRLRYYVAKSSVGDTSEDLFLLARREYLTGNTVAAERLLRERLQRFPADISARLQLATLCRRGGRIQEARQQLRQLQRWRGAATWSMEIRREWEQLTRHRFKDQSSAANSQQPLGSKLLAESLPSTTAQASAESSRAA